MADASWDWADVAAVGLLSCDLIPPASVMASLFSNEAGDYSTQVRHGVAAAGIRYGYEQGFADGQAHMLHVWLDRPENSLICRNTTLRVSP